MKKNILFLLPAMVAGFGFISADQVEASTFTTLHSFTAPTGSGFYKTNSDGADSAAGLILSGNTLYGTTVRGGNSGNGVIFAVNANGTGFTTLHHFTATPSSTNSDGANPSARLILAGNTLYGTARSGGSSAMGTLYKLNTNGTGFATVLNFMGNNGGSGPGSELTLSNNSLYGTTSSAGTVFKGNINGTGFTTLHKLIEPSDGLGPLAGLILSGNTLYGTANSGGGSSHGTVFAVHTDGTGFTTLHSFLGTSGLNDTNTDGASPSAGLILSGNTLYGTAVAGGRSGAGTVFSLNTNGTGFKTLYSFTRPSFSTNSDGSNPFASLILAGNTLYGTAYWGGSSGTGTVFALNTNGTGFTTLHSFTAVSNSTNSDGANPRAELILAGNTLYGTTFLGGSSGHGTVFSITLPPPTQLTIIRSTANIILTWPTNATAFTLQSTTNLVSTNVWSSVVPAPMVVNGQNTVTNAISGTKKFYRLTQ